MTLRHAPLLRQVSEDDDALAQIQWPQAVDVGALLVGLGLTVAAVIAAIFFAAGESVDIPGVVLLAISAAAWLAPLLGGHDDSAGFPGRLLRRCDVEIALVPLAVLNLSATVGAIDLGSVAAYQLAMFPVLVTIALVIVSRPRRRAALVTIGAYGMIVTGLTAAIRELGRVDWAGLVAWQAAVLLVIAAAVAVRVGAVAIQRQADLVARQVAAEERRHMARDVHDVVAHTLAVTMLHITAARMAVDRQAMDDAAEALEEAERQGQASLADIRRIVRLLRADDEPLGHAPQPQLADVDLLVEGYRVAGLPVDLTVSGPVGDVSVEAGLAVYRALQEALTNAARHGCGAASADLRVAGADVTLVVTNPVATATTPEAGGSGLRGMRERIAHLGGSMHIGQANGRWTLQVSVPTELADGSSGGPPFRATVGEATGELA